MAAEPSTNRRRPGRPSKGTRRAIHGSVPKDHADLYERDRLQYGLDWSDWIAWKLAVAHGLEVPEYLRNVVPLHAHVEHPGEGAVAV
ncbi:hypothetical protein [Arthrobacter woluwensis]|uniref:hypothetical protein n=1 Tax=Arthrobacter woluwensis TaxID=156980 RepID=UPI0038245A92